MKSIFASPLALVLALVVLDEVSDLVTVPFVIFSPKFSLLQAPHIARPHLIAEQSFCFPLVSPILRHDGPGG
jgi:hypothetical protein